MPFLPDKFETNGGGWRLERRTRRAYLTRAARLSVTLADIVLFGRDNA